MINKPDSLFRNRLQRLLFLVCIAGTTGMNMSVENNMLHLLCQTNFKKGPTHVFFLICLAKEMQHIIFYAHVHVCSFSYTDEE